MTSLYLRFRLILIMTAVILLLICGILIYRKTIPKINSVSNTTKQLAAQVNAAVQNGYLIHGEMLIETITSMKESEVQIIVITAADKESEKEGKIYNYSLEYDQVLPTYDSSMSKLEQEYINPGAMFMTTITKDAENKIKEIIFEQR